MVNMIIPELDLSRAKRDICTGYMYICAANHPCAKKNGIVSVHRYVMSKYLGRVLLQEELVHHKNGDKTDNRLENLEVMTAREHAQLHAQLHSPEREKIECVVCKTPTKNVKFCSTTCVGIFTSRTDLTEDTLRELVWQMPATRIAKEYGVSDVAIHKMCKKWDIDKPPRGYFLRKNK